VGVTIGKSICFLEISDAALKKNLMPLVSVDAVSGINKRR